MSAIELLFLSVVGGAIYGVAYFVFKPRRGDGRIVRYYDARGRMVEAAALFEERGASGHIGRPYGGVVRGLVVTVTDDHLLVRSRFGIGVLAPDLDMTIPLDAIRRVTCARLSRIEFENESGRSTELWLVLKWSSDFEAALHSRESETPAEGLWQSGCT